MKHTFIITLFLIVGFQFSIVNSQNALPWHQSLAYNAYLMRDVHQQYSDRNAEFNSALKSKAAMENYIAKSRENYKKIAGDFPAKLPLNAKITGVYETDGLRIENIVFESVPGRFVTCNLYLPANTKGKIPAALELCGHGINGKLGSIRTAPIIALNGIAVLVVDPIGQGERLQLVDKEGNALTRGATTEHTLLNAGLNLTGTSLAAQEFYDNSRALDYLFTRKEIDAENIAVFGSSGGGTQTAYFVGLDVRVKVAAICSFFSQRERTLEMQGASDGCQHIPYEGHEHFELADFALMHAPKPMLILSGKYDFVDVWGAQQGYADLEKAYSTLGVPEKVKMLLVETGHGLGVEKRETLIKWLRRWLLGKDNILTNSFTGRIDPAKLLCTEKGQVNISFPTAKSIMQENLEMMQKLEKNRSDFFKQDKMLIDKKIRELLGLSEPSPLKIELTGAENARDCKISRYQLIRNSEMALPCVLLVPDKTTEKSKIRVVLTEKGKNSFFEEATNTAAAVADGTIILAADLRGMGETADPPQYNDAKYWNFEYRNAMTAMHAGRPITGQRVQDILTVVDFCSTLSELKGKSIEIKADGIYGAAAIHAAFLDGRILAASVSRSLKTWKTCLENPLQYDMYSNVIYGALKYYDLPDLVKNSGRRISFGD